MNSHDIHAVMVEKGFWNSRNFTKFSSFLALRTWMQLCHAVAEYSEYMAEVDEEARLEEVADVAIVLLDLAGAHGLDINLEYTSPVMVSFHYAIGAIINRYRKLIDIDPNLVKMCLGGLMHKFGKEKFIAAVEAKMEKNKERPAVYGVAK